MDRRGFLRALGAAAVGMTLDPERLLWRPGAKTIVAMNGNPFWSSQLTSSHGELTFEMLRRTIKAINEHVGAPPKPLYVSHAIKIKYEMMLRGDQRK